MHQTLGAFRAALVTGWIVLSAAGFLYAREKNIPLWAAVPLIAAFLLEYSFYLAPGFATVRERLRARFAPRQLALAMAVSAFVPYLIYSIPTGQFRITAFAGLVSLVFVVCFWYAVLRPSVPVDVVFLLLLAAVVLSRFLVFVYTSPIDVRIDILGRVMLIRTGALAALELRRTTGTGFGFVPTQREWVTGVRYFFYFLPIGFPLALWLGLVHLTFNGFLFWKTLATFFGVLWVLALAEEFFFRGLLQNWLAEWTGRPHAALVIASILFGAAHLQFRDFPNWQFALVSAVAGVFYGLAYQKAGSVRAAMVTHALVVTTWRTIFV